MSGSAKRPNSTEPYPDHAVGEPDVVLERVRGATEVGVQPPCRHVADPRAHPASVIRRPDHAVLVPGFQQTDRGEGVAQPCELDRPA